MKATEQNFPVVLFIIIIYIYIYFFLHLTIREKKNTKDK